ncbi:MAG: NADH-quinone oxidoreductase subunit NuoF, partial [Phycisphaerales bacterium]
MPWTPKTSFPILTRRIPCWPHGNPKDRRTILIDDYMAPPASKGWSTGPGTLGGYEVLRKVVTTMTPEEVVDQVKKANVRGRGGAGFPAGMKWSFLPKPDAQGEGGPRYLAINADESEPASFKDRLLIDFDPHLVIEGIALCCYACRIQTAYFYIRGEYHAQAAIMENAIKEAYAKGILGKGGLLSGTRTRNRDLPWGVDLHLHRGAGAYICGEETGLLESIEGKRGWPRNKPPFPAIKGLFGRPTIINNVETLAHIPSVLENGPEWFAKQGTESSFPGAPPSWGTKLMGVSGHVNRPGVFECDLGIPLRTLIESKDFCQGMRGGKKFKGAIAGGISMGVLGPDQFEAEMDFDIGRKYNVLGLGTACPTVFDEGTDMVAVARNIARFYKHESCGQCTPCREGSGWLYQLLCKIEEGNAKSKD